MGRKPLPEEQRKENLTIRIPKYLVDFYKSKHNYNQYVLKVLEEYYKNVKKDNNLTK